MSSLRVFTEEDRVDIIKSAVNNSTSKQLWSFSRQKRFKADIPNCPYVSYDINQSTLSNIKTQFGKDTRKVFTECSDAPTSWNYNPRQNNNKIGCSIGLGRQNVVSNSYIEQQVIKNPGPGRYNAREKKSIAYSVRPKTANTRNYFIDDKEQKMVPGVGNYQTDFVKIIGMNRISKFKSTPSGVIGRDSRFKSYSNGVPPSWAYENFKRYSWKNGPKIGSQNRVAFTDGVASLSFTPGPGNYKLPTQFAHYKKFTRTHKEI